MKKKIKRIICIVVVLAIIIGGTGIGIVVYSKIQDYKQEIEVLKMQEVHKTDLEIIEETITRASRLETADYVCTIVEDSYGSKQLFGKDIPLTKTGYTVSFKGSVSAGIDLSKATAKQLDENTIEISLPKVEVYEPNFDNESMKKYDEKNSIFNPLKIDVVNETEINAKKKIKEEAIQYGIEARAKENAEIIVAGLMSQGLNGSEIKITWQE